MAMKFICWIPIRWKVLLKWILTANSIVFFLDDANHDTVVVCCNDKDVAVHMAHSINYK